MLFIEGHMEGCTTQHIGQLLLILMMSTNLYPVFSSFKHFVKAQVSYWIGFCGFFLIKYFNVSNLKESLKRETIVSMFLQTVNFLLSLFFKD